MFEIFENIIVQYTLFVTFFGLLTAIGLYMHKFYANIYRNGEIEEVLFFNELSNTCIDTHRHRHQRKHGTAQPPQQYSFLCGIISQPAVPFCDNVYCALRHFRRMAYFIESAQFSIDVAIYNFKTFLFFDCFKRALKRGVRVRFVSNAQNALCAGSQILPLTDLGAAVRGPGASKKLMHHKFCIIDGPARLRQVQALTKKSATAEAEKQTKIKKLRSVVLSGSLNWTTQSFNGNWENCIITSDVSVIRKYQKEFNRMWHKFDLCPKANIRDFNSIFFFNTT